MNLWIGRLFRLWLIAGLPLACYFAYQAYDYKASIPEMQRIAENWEQRRIDQEAGAMRGAFDPTKELIYIHTHIKELETISQQYLFMGAGLLVLPLLASFLVLVGGWVWGTQHQDSGSWLSVSPTMRRAAGIVAWLAGTGLLLMAVAAYAPEKLIASLIASGGQIIIIGVIIHFMRSKN